MWSKISVLFRTCFVLTMLSGATLLAIPTVRGGLHRWITRYLSVRTEDREFVWRREVENRRDRENAPVRLCTPDPIERQTPAITSVSHRPAASPRTDTTDAFRVQELRKQLELLGATNILLGKSSGSSQRIRCECELPVDGRSVFRRRFSAEAERELSAIRLVYADVSRWHAACHIPVTKRQ